MQCPHHKTHGKTYTVWCCTNHDTNLLAPCKFCRAQFGPQKTCTPPRVQMQVALSLDAIQALDALCLPDAHARTQAVQAVAQAIAGTHGAQAANMYIVAQRKAKLAKRTPEAEAAKILEAILKKV